MRRVNIESEIQFSVFSKSAYASCGHCNTMLPRLLHLMGALVDGKEYILAHKKVCSCEFVNINVPLTFGTIEDVEAYVKTELERIQSSKTERFVYVVDTISSQPHS